MMLRVLAILLPSLSLCRFLLSPLLAPPLFFFYRRRLVHDNITRAFPEENTGIHRRIHWRFCMYFCNAVFEFLKGAVMPVRKLHQRVRFHNPGMLRRRVENDETVVLLLPHYGNWEWFWLVLCEMLGKEAELCAVYRPLHVGVLDKFAVRMRTRFGGRVITDRSVGRYLRRKSPRPRILALVGDQRPGKHDAKRWVSMFGRDTALQPGVGKLPVLLQCPAFFVSVQPERPGHYSVHFLPLSEPPYSRGEEARILQSFAAAIEALVRDRPEYFLWSMNRWKHRPHDLQAVQ